MCILFFSFFPVQSFPLMTYSFSTIMLLHFQKLFVLFAKENVAHIGVKYVKNHVTQLTHVEKLMERRGMGQQSYVKTVLPQLRQMILLEVLLNVS